MKSDFPVYVERMSRRHARDRIRRARRHNSRLANEARKLASGNARIEDLILVSELEDESYSSKRYLRVL